MRRRADAGVPGETLDGARLVLRDHLVPRLFAGPSSATSAATSSRRAAARSGAARRPVASAEDRSLRSSAVRRDEFVDAGVAIGITDDEKDLRALAVGVRRGGLPAMQGEDRTGRPTSRSSPRSGPRSATTSCSRPTRTGRTRSRRRRRARARSIEFALQCLEQPLAPDALRDACRGSPPAADTDRASTSR